ncbi:hypothetical protein CONLIGDRAFT_685918 [Coniochaeta ligniaria NRRL 30616]|uniref:Uncharacterized protein n=1 Tax=Coniochaeta ligniaria NRRL 30616 TaxID=1408157 RepID=A0A1J7J577_9PEZI|nr:hypothetical protein CONLIGDRAFT_685918 [Coniochaeta ligniaria NRRL 30616]
MAYQELLYTFTARPEPEIQILSSLDTSMSLALIWWDSYLITQRFGQDPAVITTNLTQGKLHISDVAHNGNPDLMHFGIFVQKQGRYARSMRILDDNAGHSGKT